MKRAIEKFSIEEFIQILQLPDDLKLVYVELDHTHNEIKIYGSSELYPEVYDGCESPIVKKEYR